jgi:hypothetical protein
MKNTAKKLRHASKASSKSLFILKAGYWLASIAVVIFGWSIIATPLGEGIPTKGIVTGYQLNAKGQKMAVIELRDGSVIRKMVVSTPIGGYVECLRYVKKYLPTESYECP